MQPFFANGCKKMQTVVGKMQTVVTKMKNFRQRWYFEKDKKIPFETLERDHKREIMF